MKLKKVEREYTLRGETIKVQNVPAIEVAKLSSLSQSEEFKNVEKQVEYFSKMIFDYTSLKDDNTLEEIRSLMSLAEMIDLGSFILEVDTTSANFTKSQSTGNLTTDSE